ncbi:MAG: sugar ABC transporter ATP-binding protein [Planctomycetota bacterium]|nr:sugar ABC transporter ATP-binding protein [Planctomycetota bacterium]
MAEPAVRFEGLVKRFPGALAVDGVSFEVAAGTVHALCGENGAGKSTLGKILAGILAPDAGTLRLFGRPVRFGSPRDALAAGVGMVHQELAFCENLSVAENLCLEDLPRRGPFVSRARMRERARERLAAIGAELDLDRPLGELSVGRQQLVQIAAAVGSGARVIVFDEPSSSLSRHETERLLELLRALRARGVTSLYVSHRMDEIFELCDAVTVLRDGRHVETRPVAGLGEAELVRLMIGRPLDAYVPAHLRAEPGAERLRVENFSSPGRFEDACFSLRAGEVLGLAGLVGAGRTELAQALFGLDSYARGRVQVDGREAAIGDPAQAMRLGLGLAPEDRKRHGLVLSMSAGANVTLPTLRQDAAWGWVRAGRERERVRGFFERLRVRAPGPEFPAAGLSGGNQQKLVLAKWLAAACGVLILDEPTRGVDVGAKAEIHALIDGLAREGRAVLLISSELPELVKLCTRILVMRAGRLVADVPRAEATQETLLRHMAGVA